MIRKLLFVIAVGMMILVLTDCKSGGGDPEPNEADVQLGKLTATWKCSAATKGGVAQDGYNDFKLILSGTAGSDTFNYSCTDRPSLSPWPANGTWKFGTNVATDITRDSDLPVSYSVTDSQLQVTFTYSGAGFAGRTNEVNGTWVFTFTK